jgi:hypothetical protein
VEVFHSVCYSCFVVVVDEDVPPGVTVVFVSVFFSVEAGGLTIVVFVSFFSLLPPAGGVTTVVSFSTTLSPPAAGGDSIRCSQAAQSDAPIRANTIFFI